MAAVSGTPSDVLYRLGGRGTVGTRIGAVFRLQLGMVTVLGGAAMLGLVLHLVGLV